MVISASTTLVVRTKQDNDDTSVKEFLLAFMITLKCIGLAHNMQSIHFILRIKLTIHMFVSIRCYIPGWCQWLTQGQTGIKNSMNPSVPEYMSYTCPKWGTWILHTRGANTNSTVHTEFPYTSPHPSIRKGLLRNERWRKVSFTICMNDKFRKVTQLWVKWVGRIGR